jgi:hypothetical protein
MFEAIATDRAGFSASNSVFVIYDPGLATNMPAFTMNVTNAVVVVASNTTTFALSGAIDDDNAVVQIDVVDAADNTITNASVSVAVRGTNWWGESPVMPGTNLVAVSAWNTGSATNTQSFTMIQDPSVWLEILSPAPYATANATNVWVVGLASTNFDGAITLNGQPVLAGTNLTSIVFSNAIPTAHVGANIIEVHAECGDGRSATVRQIVYGYEVVVWREENSGNWTHASADCWFARHYPDDHEYREHWLDVATWQAPEAFVDDLYEPYVYSYSGQLLHSGPFYDFWEWNPYELPFGFRAGWQTTDTHSQFKHLDAGWPNYLYNCFWQTNCVCESMPYCEGEDTSTCCIDTDESEYYYERTRHEISFIKHWPVDEEQTVILHFDRFYYLDRYADDAYHQDADKIRFCGQTGFVHSTDCNASDEIGKTGAG